MFETIIQDARKYREDFSSGIQAQINRTGRQCCKQAKGRVRKSNNGFLTVVFNPLPLGDFNPLFSEENYKHLYESILVYARLLGSGKKLDYDPRDFESLYKFLQDILPVNQELRIGSEDDESLRLWVFDTQHEDNTLYYLPCSIITRSEGLFRDILVSFFALLQKKQRLTPLSESMYFEHIQEEFYSSDEEDLDEGWVELVKRYTEGDICEILELIEKKPKYSVQRLRKVLSEFIPHSRREQKMKELITEGLKFLSKRISIRTYAIAPDIDQDYAWAIEIDNVIQIIYDADAVNESQVQFYNECAQESGFEFISGGWIEVTPNTTSLLKISKYVRDFMNWLNRLNDELYYA